MEKAMATTKKTGKKTESKKEIKMAETLDTKATHKGKKNNISKPTAEEKSTNKRGRPSAQKEEEKETKSSPEPTAKNQDEKSSAPAKEQAEVATPQAEVQQTESNPESPLNKYMRGEKIVIDSTNVGDAVKVLKEYGKINSVSPSEIKTIPTTPKPEPTAKPIKSTSLDFLTPNSTFNGTQEFKNEYGSPNSQLPQVPVTPVVVDNADELKKYAKSFYENVEQSFQFKMWGYVPMAEINRMISVANKKYKYTVVELGDVCQVVITHDKLEESTPQFKFQ